MGGFESNTFPGFLQYFFNTAFCHAFLISQMRDISQWLKIYLLVRYYVFYSPSRVLHIALITNNCMYFIFDVNKQRLYF